jgi:3-oxoacyl-[acyl-carrier protein] reductase
MTPSPRHILITGATGAVGRALVARACSAGWHVTGVFRQNRAGADDVQRTVAGQPGTLLMEPCDLTDSDAVARLLARLPGDYCPDALVHLAAAKLDFGPIQSVRWDDYQHQIDGTLKPVILLTNPLLKRMARRGNGRIIAAVSAVVQGTPPRGFAAYSVAKYALLGYARCLAAEYAGRGITVNTVSPGPINSELLVGLPSLLTDQMKSAVPGQQWIDPDSVAGSIFWLASEAGPEMTGSNLSLSAGLTF